MIEGLKTHSSYRTSLVPWVLRLPEHWGEQRLRQCVELLVSNVDKLTHDAELPVRLCNYTDVYKNERIHAGMKFMRASASESELRRFRLRVGDVLVTKDSEDWRDIAVPAYVGEEADDLVCGYHLAILRPRVGGLEGEFLYWMLRAAEIASQFRVSANGVTRFGLTQASIRDALVPLPPLEEQRAIVRFLDYADRRIRKYIAAKRKLIALLEEQKRAIVDRAVTRGLDPNVRLKNSGVPWIGMVPDHWVVTSLRFRYDQCLGKMVDAKQATGTHLIPYLRNVDVRWGRINTTNLPLIDIAPHERERFTVRPGDLLACEGRHLGRCAFWSGEIEVCGFQKALHRLRALDRNIDEPRFLFYCMRLANARDAFNMNKQDSAIPHLTGEMLRAHRFPFPPIDEQRAIVACLDAELTRADRGCEALRQEISLLDEYHARLVSDVVTGAFDVREAASRLPQEVEDESRSGDLDDADDDEELIDEETAA